MLLSTVSVFVVALPSSEVPKGLMNYLVFRYVITVNNDLSLNINKLIFAMEMRHAFWVVCFKLLCTI